jgi:HEPN domain-containing protein
VITLEDLQRLSRDRLEDAKALYVAGRYDGAFYICGYSIELGLKKKICETLKWEGYPDGKKEFEHLKSFKTHDLDMLLHLSGVENQIKGEVFTEWSIVVSWDPEMRYSSSKQTEQSAKLLLESAETLLKKL